MLPSHSKLLHTVIVLISLPGLAHAAGQQQEADPLVIVNSLMTTGAPGLALHYIDVHQDAGGDIAQWVKWERLRIRLLQDKRDWDAVSQRAAQVRVDAPVAFSQWLLAEAAEAELNRNDPAAARAYLRRLIWKTKSSRKQMAKWRRLVIRSYLVENRIDDARTALLRYKTDYRATNDAWQTLHAKVLIRGGEFERAFQLLRDVQTVDAQLLRLHAALYGKVYKPAVVSKRCRQLAAKPQLTAEQRQQTWVLAADAVARENDRHNTVAFLELAINTNARMQPEDPFFPVSADGLWQAYLDYAEYIGNRERLLIGDDAPWLKKAEVITRTDKVASRALFAFLALRGTGENAREKAHQQLSASLLLDNKAPVARTVYAQSKKFVVIDDLPDSVRYQLANEALKVHDIQLAARWMKDLKQPPVGEDRDDWILKRARTLIYAGDTREAIVLLEKMLDDHKLLEPALAKKTIQVLFDLQAVREHAGAHMLMEKVYGRIEEASVRRELLYWMGESQDALGKHENAAELYLRSATLGHPKGADLWGQSARYQAAESLGKAGLADDARSIYQRLLRYTSDAKRRALIERKIQQLWLVESQTTTQ
jgi:hypothetical protein